MGCFCYHIQHSFLRTDKTKHNRLKSGESLSSNQREVGFFIDQQVENGGRGVIEVVKTVKLITTVHHHEFMRSKISSDWVSIFHSANGKFFKPESSKSKKI